MLKAYWKLNGDALDSSGNGYNGTINGIAAWIPGHIGAGNALQFDGITTYIDAGTQLNLTGQFTILGWFKLGSTSGWRAIISKGEGPADALHNYFIEFNNYNVYFGFGDGVNDRIIEILNAVNDFNWHHLAAVFTSSTDMKVYIDGLQKTGTYSGTASVLTPNTRRTIIGGFSSTSDLYSGALQEIKVHDTALTQAEILADYIAAPGGSILCITTPSGASITLDGTLQSGAITPVTLTNVPAGPHTMTFRLSGYNDCMVNVSVTAGSTATASCTLTPVCTALGLTMNII